MWVGSSCLVSKPLYDTWRLASLVVVTYITELKTLFVLSLASLTWATSILSGAISSVISSDQVPRVSK